MVPPTLNAMLARDNPFATERVRTTLSFNPTWQRSSWHEIDKRWLHLNKRACITGRHGAGKSTFLDAWEQRLTAEGQEIIRIFLNLNSRKISPAQWQSLQQCHGKIILIDGEEQLSYFSRKKFYRLAAHAEGVLATRHSKGSQPTLLHLEPSIEDLHRCVKILAPNHFSQLSPLLPQWWKQHRGNIREILLRCYDHMSEEAQRSYIQETIA